MPCLIATDEAGYGPNLGPLVISASVWEVPDGVRSDDLYRCLDKAVSPGKGGPRNDPRVPIADSKILYQSGKGLRVLESGLLASLAVLGQRPDSSDALWTALAPESTPVRRTIPWYDDSALAFPLAADPARCEALAALLADGLAEAGIRLTALASRAIFEEEFNDLVDRHGSKGEALSTATLALVARLAQNWKEGPLSILCDKHGGRNAYSRLLSEAFAGSLIEIYGEGREESLYRFGPAQRRIEIRFRAKAETHLPAALASMASKYLRELAMRALNAFWLQHVPRLAPTAGYPLDARRFKEQIAAAQTALSIDDRRIWRIK